MLLLILQALIKIISFLPVRFSLWLGRAKGRLAYFLLSRYRKMAYSNIRFFLTENRKEALEITKGLFENLGVYLIEIFRFFRLNKENIDSCIDFEGLENLDNAISKKKGIILLTAHLGNWELSSIALSLKGYCIKVLARQQRDNRLDELLNFYRQSSGIKVVKKGMALREIIQGLRNNEIVGMLGDQGGKSKGICVNFFGRYIFLPSGFLDIALKTGATVLPTFIFPVKSGFASRKKDKEKYKLVINPPLNCKETKKEVVQRYADILQEYISSFPKQYLWIYNFRKSTFSKSILILDDGKAGHLNQSKAIASQIKEIQSERYPEIFPLIKTNNMFSGKDAVEIKIKEVKYRSSFGRFLLTFCSLFASLRCVGCLKCMQFCLTNRSYKELIESPTNIIISSGSSSHSLNIFLKKENCAKNITIMSPPKFLINSFDLIITPKHDNLVRENILSILGAPNLITPQSVERSAKGMKEKLGIKRNLVIGIFIGSGPYLLINKMLEKIINVSRRLEAEILLTTSRRTSLQVEKMIKQKLANFPLCRLLIIANEENIEDAVGKILGLSKLVIVTSDSISMISEAASSGRPVIILDIDEKKKKKKEFLKKLIEEKNIDLISVDRLEKEIIEVHSRKGKIGILDDKEKIKKRLEQIL